MYRCSNADRDYGMFSSGEVSGVQEHTKILQHTNCAIHSAKKRIKDIEREKKKEGNFLLAKTWINSTHNSSQIPTHNIDSFQK